MARLFPRGSGIAKASEREWGKECWKLEELAAFPPGGLFLAFVAITITVIAVKLRLLKIQIGLNTNLTTSGHQRQWTDFRNLNLVYKISIPKTRLTRQ